MQIENTIHHIVARSIRQLLQQCSLDYEKLQEIRLRVGQPVWIMYENKGNYLLQNGRLGSYGDKMHIVTKQDLKETMEYISNYSIYAHEEQIRHGFITVQGGHRVGIAGKVVLENNKIKNISHIGMINIRFAHEKIGCSEKILPFLKENGQLYNTLLIAPPGGGKTTLLRDLVRILSSPPENYTVGVVDERSELAGCYMGIPQNNMGVLVDVLDGCPKVEGMFLLLRTMAPDVIVVDEIGTPKDLEMMAYVTNCGCGIFATIHGASIHEVLEKKSLRSLLEMRMFQRFVVLGNRTKVGTVKGIYNERGELMQGEIKI